MICIKRIEANNHLCLQLCSHIFLSNDYKKCDIIMSFVLESCFIPGKTHATYGDCLCMHHWNGSIFFKCLSSIHVEQCHLQMCFVALSFTCTTYLKNLFLILLSVGLTYKPGLISSLATNVILKRTPMRLLAEHVKHS